MGLFRRREPLSLLNAARLDLEARRNAFRSAFEALPRAARASLMIDAALSLGQEDLDKLDRAIKDAQWARVRAEGV